MKITKIIFSCLPRNRTSWLKYMLNGISKHNFLDMSQLVRLRGKHTTQTAHCALQQIYSAARVSAFNAPSSSPSSHLSLKKWVRLKPSAAKWPQSMSRIFSHSCQILNISSNVRIKDLNDIGKGHIWSTPNIPSMLRNRLRIVDIVVPPTTGSVLCGNTINLLLFN